MPSNADGMNILFIGDIVGKPGRQIVKALLPKIVEEYKIELVIANGENSAGGFGITEKIGQEIFSFGVDIITTGNHVWDKKEAIPYIAKEPRVLRPLNYPANVPGTGSTVIRTKRGNLVGVLNVSGRVFMNLLDCPFRTTKKEIERIRQQTKFIFIDFHAEATSEKIAFGYYFDGQVSATGPEDSVIGFKLDEVIDKFLLHMPQKFEVPSVPAIFSAAIVEVDSDTGLSKNIKRLMLRQN